jgi:hypothetical protein
MEPMQIALITNNLHPVEALSARPDAPVLPHIDRRPAAAVARAQVAGALHRLADAVAPSGVAKAHRHAYAGGRVR